MAEDYEQRLKEEYARVSRGGKPRRTFNEMMARFIREHFPNLKSSSARRYKSSIGNLRDHFDGKFLDEINKGNLSDLVTERRKLVTGASIRRDLACLSSAMELAIGWDWIDANPVKSLNKRSIKESSPRTRYLSKEEYTTLLVNAGPYLKPMIKFAVSTGLRLDEQLSLTWDQIDFPRREVVIPVTKSGTPRTVPLTQDAMDSLRSLTRYLHSDFVFCKSDGTRYRKLTRGLAGASKRAGIEDLRWHDLRRTCGSWMLQDGTSIEVVSKWLGHKSIAVTERSYAFLRTVDLHAAAQKRSHDTRISVGENA